MSAHVEGSGRRPTEGVATRTWPAFGTLQRRNPRDGVLGWCGWLYEDCGSALLGWTRVRPTRAATLCRARWSAMADLVVTRGNVHQVLINEKYIGNRACV